MSSHRDHNLAALLLEGSRDPRAAAIVEPEGETLSHGELERRIRRLVGTLRSLGVAAGDRVAVQSEKSVESVLLYVACLRVGAAYLPLQGGATPVECARFIEDARPRLLVCRPGDEPRHAAAVSTAGVAEVRSLGPRTGSLLEDASLAAEDPAIEAVAPDDLAAILYTSGTTGRSKGAMLSHRNLAANARSLLEAWRFDHPAAGERRSGRDRLLHVLPIDHVHGLFVALHTLLASGGEILWRPRFDAAESARLLGECTLFMGVPTHYVRLLAEPSFHRDRLGGIRAFISGSAPLLEETFLEFEARTGRRILERYGMTEAGMIASNPYDDESSRRPGVVGRPLPGVELRLADEQGRIVGSGEVGAVEIRGESVSRGYWNMPERRATDFRADGFFVSGDLGRLEADGMLRLVGRASDMVISGGLNVYPKEIEMVLDRLPGVRESAVFGVPHPDLGEAVVAVVVATEPTAPPEERSLIAAARESLAGFKCPKRVIVLAELPRNAMGKVQKRVLRDAHRSLLA